jgi:uncharacterized SAM-binding protein YcdF (DUF218 family)
MSLSDVISPCRSISVHSPLMSFRTNPVRAPYKIPNNQKTNLFVRRLSRTMAGGRRRRQQQLQQQMQPPRGWSFPAYPTAAGTSASGQRRDSSTTIYSLRCLVLGTIAFVAAIGLLLLVNQATTYYRGRHPSSSSSTTTTTTISSRRSITTSSRERNSIRKVDSPSLSTTSSEGMPKGKGVYGSPSDLSDALVESLDAVLVLGGGRPSRHDRPPVYVQNRCDDAAHIVRKKRQLVGMKKQQQQQQQEEGGTKGATDNIGITDDNEDLPVLCLSAGTAHVPQLVSSVSGLPVWESTASSAFLLRHHNLTQVFVETTSYDTIGNAYYARTSHTEWNGWRTLLIVTSEVRAHPAAVACRCSPRETCAGVGTVLGSHSTLLWLRRSSFPPSFTWREARSVAGRIPRSARGDSSCW